MVIPEQVNSSEFEERTGIKIKLEVNKNIDLDTDIELVLFRIMQEALTNVARHSEAEHAVITF
jgi:two-component system sensor histidine kinase UhpB